MHKKSRLEERIEACADIVKVADLSDKNMKRAALTHEYVPFNEIFGNNNPVYLEIGCGKGKFVCEMAKMLPQVNFIACEKISNVLIEALERAKAENIKNVYFLNCAAEVLEKYFPQGSVERIYLNFSNPLPKEGYKKQRLTHPRFLNIYAKLLKKGGQIFQKTDDEDFYKFSVESFKEVGFEVLSTCENYLLTEKEDVETEHERRFKDMGKRIFRVVVKV
ncbi:MAG: tRNA (guanosine(46)-N7)-methyltransferase TrmB [Clostridia bacterium]|nr:tRNA (guanosine(46)-N7)-methyltransferase TrmB [Clostridia bacterium]